MDSVCIACWHYKTWFSKGCVIALRALFTSIIYLFISLACEKKIRNYSNILSNEEVNCTNRHKNNFAAKPVAHVSWLLQ